MAEPQLKTQSVKGPNVHKFGGSSLRDEKRMAQVIQTIKETVQGGDFVVVSANGKVTDMLLAIIQGQTKSLKQLSSYLLGLVASVLNKPQALKDKFNQDLDWLEKQISKTENNQHELLALGELWSAQLLSASLLEQGVKNQWLDAREYLEINTQNQLINHSQAKTQLFELVNQNRKDLDVPGIQVITGYIARDSNGQSKTLGRNGSDYTATLIANLLDANTVYLWTDVDGVYTADPHLIKQARRVERLTLAEAQALSELGSNVLHHKTIAPILKQPPRLAINTCISSSSGTVIENNNSTQFSASGFKVKTLACKSQLVYLAVSEVDELTARQIQTQLTVDQITNYANHYDKTSHTLSFYVEQAEWFSTSQKLNNQGLSLHQQISNVSLISAVGENIRQNHQVISKILNRSAKFNIHNIHYPANDHTLCVLVPDAQARTLLEDLHHTFFGLEPSIPIVVLGYGNIGKQFLSILNTHKAEIERQVKQSLSVVAVANSRFFQFDEQCLLSQEISLNETNQQGQLIQHLQVYAGKPLVVVDLTASEAVASHYLEFAQNGWHLISANKIAAADHEQATRIETTLQKRQRKWLKNTTVGAGLPIQDAIDKIKQSGDTVRQVSGVFSGTLSWLFGNYKGQQGFMDWVRKAHQMGYSEPDPRDDLSGEDVFRKALILARECGFEAQNIDFKPVLPQALLDGDIDDFWHQQEAIDQYIEDLWQQAHNHGSQLCYLATIKSDRIEVALQAIDQQHAAAGLKPGDNVFVIESAWYAENPLVIQGPGAGKEVTAAGVLNDLIAVLQH
ncbi:MAG: bifunctional aspartate kinase/homoserine dehydrogenase II [Xanthomonadales bacterium]|nr:bifunctional aspartate kinase/homoserine dehydrogenase II [Xanthomonadales bacterium]